MQREAQKSIPRFGCCTDKFLKGIVDVALPAAERFAAFGNTSEDCDNGESESYQGTVELCIPMTVDCNVVVHCVSCDSSCAEISNDCLAADHHLHQQKVQTIPQVQSPVMGMRGMQ